MAFLLLSFLEAIYFRAFVPHRCKNRFRRMLRTWIKLCLSPFWNHLPL